MLVVTSEAVFYSVCPEVGRIKTYLREDSELSQMRWSFVKVILQVDVTTATFESHDNYGRRMEAWVRAMRSDGGVWELNHTWFRFAL